MNLAPIVLFVYNRPWHTEQTLNALMQNDLANQSVLFICADGPKENATEEQIENIKKVRQLIRNKQWCKEIYFVESDKNKGLANSIIDGVSEIVNKHGKVIVLEDDIITSEQFLVFMNGALEKYKNKEEIFGVSGFNYPSKVAITGTHFLTIGCSWGWGTWSTRWHSIEFDALKLESEIRRQKSLHNFDFGGYPFYKMLNDQISGNIDSWAIRFYASMFLAGGLFVYPPQSLVNNIGFDETASHTKESDNFFDKVTINKIEMEFPEPVIDSNSESVKKTFEEKYQVQPHPLLKPSAADRVYNKIKKLIG